ncbi:apolipoprotein acyltransferase [Thetidibacter halocola]|jgi:hypothetical protein|uniref:Apolipoprotein acyltransferase n=1 Tax=Thetidibacter halocola TaxID=2827239 RepID=A0A8J7WFC5_9RHOB|nr:apolipoprotein acyltransferase [Thetidibacter halocola]MBS0124346.1 apolipoprotein acyltransferase [Thetidibacter halocola]
MIVISGVILGAISGGLMAARRKGNKADILQYAAGYGIFFGLLGLIATIVLEKSLA